MDDQHILDAIDSYMLRLALIERTQALLDSPERLQAVEQVTLGAGARESLDRICGEVADVANVPLAAVTLIDDRHQRYVGAYGCLDKTEPRDRSLCMFVAASGQTFDLNDLTDQEKISCIAFTEKDIRAYLGSPVKIENLTVGALCVVDYEPREWTKLVRDLVNMYAGKVSEILEEERT